MQHGGKALSYLNLYDTEAAWRLVHRFDRPACVIVKHANPCGVAVADDIATAYERAHACDPVSAFGGIVALNRPVTEELARRLAPVFTEVVVAPGYDEAALGGADRQGQPARARRRRRRARRRSTCGPSTAGCSCSNRTRSPWTGRRGGSSRRASRPPSSGTTWSSPGRCAPPCRRTPSSCAEDGQAFGIGAGQQNRVDSARIAADRAGDRAVGGVCASDAFFPFRDGLDVAAAAGVTAVIQPGGSVRDAEVIDAADEHGIAMVFTGERHFRH